MRMVSRVASGLLAAVIGIGSMTAATRPGALGFSVALPEHGQLAAQAQLVVKDVQVPSNRSAIFRMIAINAGSETFLGSFAVVGSSPDATGTTRHPEFRVNVTTTLANWLRTHPGARTLEIRIEPVDGQRRVLKDMGWSAREVFLEFR